MTLQQSFLIDPLLASMLDGLQEAVWLLDAQTLRVVHANAASMQLTGYTPEQAQEQYVDVLCASLVQKAFWQDASNWVGGAKFLTEICTANGSLTAVEMGVGSIALNPRWLMLTMLDRSEQLRHESELDMLLAELRATLESAADGMLVCDLRGGIRAFNHRFAELWQLPEPLLVQRDDAAVFAHLEAQTISSDSQFTLLQDAQDLSAPETSEVLQLLSGRVLERRSVPQLSRGVAIGRIYSYRDITVESSSATELRLAARVFESSLDGIFIADANGVIVQVNPAGGQLLHGKAVLGLAAWTLFESEGGPVSDLLELAAARWDVGSFWEGNLWLKQSEGQRCAVWLSWVALRDGYGRLVQSIGFMRDMTMQRSAQKQIEQLAYSDALTGLPNRLSLSRHVQAAITAARFTQQPFSILFLDLDRFKIINDSLGHDFGDRVLKLVAQRLSGLLRPADVLCRQGGDEFVLYLHDCTGEGASAVAARILDEMRQPFMLDGLGFSVQCSIGAAQFPADGLTLDELIRQADIAMYRVKERGRGNFSFYQPQMSAGLLSRMKLEHAMRHAPGAGQGTYGRALSATGTYPFGSHRGCRGLASMDGPRTGGDLSCSLHSLGGGVRLCGCAGCLGAGAISTRGGALAGYGQARQGIGECLRAGVQAAGLCGPPQIRAGSQRLAGTVAGAGADREHFAAGGAGNGFARASDRRTGCGPGH